MINNKCNIKCCYKIVMVYGHFKRNWKERLTLCTTSALPYVIRAIYLMCEERFTLCTKSA